MAQKTAGILIDKYKYNTFKLRLQEAGFSFVAEKNLDNLQTWILKLTFEETNLAALTKVIDAANQEAFLKRLDRDRGIQ